MLTLTPQSLTPQSSDPRPAQLNLPISNFEGVDVNEPTILARASTIALAALSALIVTGAAMAQTFPTKPIRSVAPYSAGSGPDAVMRFVGDKVSRAWSQQLVVDNRPGANGFIAIGE